MIIDQTICNEPKKCTGCRACAAVCPKGCITMQKDAEGFYYPVVDNTKCVHCDLCRKRCPINQLPTAHNVIEGYAVRYDDTDILLDSTSGGSFTAIAQYIFAHDGIVYGVGYNEQSVVRHFSITKEEASRIIEMRGSKYVQSDLGDVFNEIAKHLKEGRYVCFSGTPCQVAGLRAFLGKEYDTLLTIDLVCHGVASPKVFEAYLKEQEEKYQTKITGIKFRNKTYGYHSGTMMLELQDRKPVYSSARIDHMLKSYFTGACSRYSCYVCPFKGMQRYGDLTVFDSWHINELTGQQLEDDCGFTNVFVNTEKGRVALQEMKHLLKYQVDPELMRKKDGRMIDHYPEMASCRKEFITGIDENGLSGQVDRYLPITFKDHVVERLKSFLYSTALLHKVKQLQKRSRR